MNRGLPVLVICIQFGGQSVGVLTTVLLRDWPVCQVKSARKRMHVVDLAQFLCERALVKATSTDHGTLPFLHPAHKLAL
jgi:hypothetical protein